MEAVIIGALTSIATCLGCLVFFCIFVKLEKKCTYDDDECSTISTNQQEDIYNISSRVQGQGQWPTHNAHIPVDQLTIANELNKHADEPPSYEEAMRLALAASVDPRSNVVPQSVPKTTN